MKKSYDFSKGKRGAVVPAPAGTTRVTIPIDDDVLNWFRNQLQESIPHRQPVPSRVASAVIRAALGIDYDALGGGPGSLG